MSYGMSSLGQQRHVGYLTQLFEPRRFIEVASVELEPYLDKFDGFISTGLSGGPAVTLLGYHFNKPFAIVRKETEACHSTYKIETSITSGRFLIVDDLICTGRTIVNIVSAMDRELDVCTLAGGWFYEMNGFRTPEEMAGEFCAGRKRQDYIDIVNRWDSNREEEATRVRY